MPRPQWDKDYPIFSPSNSTVKKKTEAATVPSVRPSKVMLTLWIQRQLIKQLWSSLTKIKCVASWVNGMDESVRAHLDTIDGAMHKINPPPPAESWAVPATNHFSDASRCRH